MSTQRKFLVSIVSFLIILLLCSVSFAKKKKVAVLPFDDGSLRVWWKGRWSPGTGISDLVLTDLVNSKKFDVIEREKIGEVLKEQGFGQTGMVDERTAAKLGKLIGVEILITGKVTRFDIEEKEIKAKGFKLGKLRGVSYKTSIAHTKIDARLIDVNTGKILLAVSGEGKKEKKGFSIRSVDWARLSFESSDFKATILGQATEEAVSAVVNKIVESYGKVEGKVIKVKGEKIYVTLGEGEVKKGDILEAFKVGEELIDPDTGEVLDVEEEKVGSIKVVEVKEKYSITNKIEGNIEKGNIARPKKK